MVDELTVKIAVPVDQDDGLVVLAGQFTDHRLLGFLAVAAECLNALEPAAFLIGNLDHQVFLEQAGLVERSAV